jgi:Holliday junction resolvase RusA-like endonuclease
MIKIVIPGLPPSDNHAYQSQRKRQGRSFVVIRTLSPEGRKYKRETTAFIAQNHAFDLASIKLNHPYGLAIQFAFESLENKTWPKRAETRYKKTDAGNRRKLVEDCLAESGGYDDSQHLTIITDKCSGPEEETRIWLWDMVEEGDLPADVIQQLQGL